MTHANKKLCDCSGCAAERYYVAVELGDKVELRERKNAARDGVTYTPPVQNAPSTIRLQ